MITFLLGLPTQLQGGVNFCCGAGDAPFSGSFDASAATIAAVPEPSSWALLIAGFELAGATPRRHVGPALPTISTSTILIIKLGVIQ